jgi:hypothetical protein
MKTTIILLMCTALCGCALLDSMLGERTVQATDEQGRPLYETPAGELTTDPADLATGLPNAPKQITLVNPDGARSAVEWLSALGPWGALAGAVTTLAAGIYARARNRQRLNEAGLRRQAEQQLDLTGSALTFALRMIEKIKQGEAVDANRDGRISLKELKQWVQQQGRNFEDPRYLSELVRIANAALPQTEQQALLRRALQRV